MLVGKRMTQPVITINPDMPIQDALNLMKKEGVRRFPVIDKKGELVGIVAESDLLNASPSDVSSLSVFELTYLLSKIKIDGIMTKNVITVSEDMPIEEAARIMADKKIGGLPVMRDNKVVGMITETDLFKTFLELLGARTPGIRLTVLVKDVPGKLLELTQAICKVNGNIISVSTFLGESARTGRITFKIENVDLNTLKKAIEPYVEHIEDIREMKIA
jgi:acetoin utilization protein AcuB